MSGHIQIPAIDPNPNPFERNRFEFGGVLTKRGIDPSCGLVEVRLRTEHEGEDGEIVYPRAHARGELGERLLARRKETPLLVRGRVEPYLDKDWQGKDAVFRRFVVDEILSTNSTNLPGFEFDRDIVEYGGIRGEVSEAKETRAHRKSGDPEQPREKSMFRWVELASPGVSGNSLPIKFGAFEDLGEEVAALAPNSEVCIQAVERTYFGSGSGGPRMRRLTSVTAIVDSRSPEAGAVVRGASVTAALSELSAGLESSPAF
jgi:hypothetical protein